MTGATGFLGARVLAPLQARGFEIHVAGRSPPKCQQVVFHQADILQAEQLRSAVQSARATHLLHLAWYAEPGQFWSSPLNLDWVSASLNLVRTFVETGGLRAVIAGTCAEYQWGPDRFYETEFSLRACNLVWRIEGCSPSCSHGLCGHRAAIARLGSNFLPLWSRREKRPARERCHLRPSLWSGISDESWPAAAGFHACLRRRKRFCRAPR